MPVNTIVTNKFGLSMVEVSGDIYRLMSTNESSSISTNAIASSSDIYAPYISEADLVQNNLFPGEEFCYTLYNGTAYEVGFGQVVASGGYQILNRINHVYYFDGFNKTRLAQPYPFEGPRLFLQVSPPPSLDDSLIYSNSVLCTSLSGISTVVQLPDNTLLGCKDNAIQSIDNSELMEMFGNDIPGTLAGKSVNCAALNLYSIRLLPSGRPINPPRGTIIYNDQSNVIEFYNGNSWSAL